LPAYASLRVFVGILLVLYCGCCLFYLYCFVGLFVGFACLALCGLFVRMLRGWVVSLRVAFVSLRYVVSSCSLLTFALML